MFHNLFYLKALELLIKLESQARLETRFFRPWGQYVRTDGKLKGGAGVDGKRKEGL